MLFLKTVDRAATSFIVVVVFAEELAAITAATAPRGNGEVGVAAARIG